MPSTIKYESLRTLLNNAEQEARKMLWTPEALQLESERLNKNCPGGRITLDLNESFQHDADIEDYGVIVQSANGAEITRKDWDRGKASFIGQNHWHGVGFVDIGSPVTLPIKAVVVMKRWKEPRTFTFSGETSLPLTTAGGAVAGCIGIMIAAFFFILLFA